jgi:organic hydroperoxide reductase OsmC/OhrA
VGQAPEQALFFRKPETLILASFAMCFMAASGFVLLLA